MIKKLLLTFLLSTTFVYGLVAGYFKIFSYDRLQTIKATLLTQSVLKKSFIDSPSYISNVELFKGLSNDYDIVFLGDSITYSGLWSEVFLDKKVANRGVRGDTSEGILNRIDQILSLTPNTVYLMFGINDIAGGAKANDIFERYN